MYRTECLSLRDEMMVIDILQPRLCTLGAEKDTGQDSVLGERQAFTHYPSNKDKTVVI